MAPDPRCVAIHEVLQEGLARVSDVPFGIQESWRDLQEHFRLSQCRNVQVSEDITEVLLRHRGAEDAD